ncbi:Hypothetical predicted protein [Lecanosticta acicola]|uniref:Uncharacterized protein n=1 Tax=Lecanosticta acicola TaxID=111012 RepID=A0AAI8YYH5_9PEZI|nr:Hypothetical predicted protein [Lecanosticta acicola]
MDFEGVSPRDLLRRMDALEANNVALSTENAALRRRVDTMETQMEALEARAEDLTMKVAVLRESKWQPSSQRVFATLELIEQILLLVPAKQLFSLQRVSRVFQHAITGLSSLQTPMFQNAKDKVLPSPQLPMRRELSPALALNPFLNELKGQWRSSAGHGGDYSGIDLKLFPSKWQDASYWVYDDLAASFSVRIGSVQDTRAAINALSTSLGRTYMTSPALPTSIRVNFVDALRIRDRREYERACKLPSSCPPNVTAIVEVWPATLLHMLKVADILERYYRAGEKEWIRHEVDQIWTPKSAAEVERTLLTVVRTRPTYSGWTTEGPYRP